MRIEFDNYCDYLEIIPQFPVVQLFQKIEDRVFDEKGLRLRFQINTEASWYRLGEFWSVTLMLFGFGVVIKRQWGY